MRRTKKNKGITQLKSRYGRMFTYPWLVGIILFSIVPIIQSAIYSLSKVVLVPGGVEINFVGISNYKNLFLEHGSYMSWFNKSLTSLLYSLPLIVLLSIVLALFLNQKFHGRLFFRALYFLPVIIASSSVMTWLFGSGESDLSNLGVSEAYTAGMFSADDIVNNLQIDGKIADYITDIMSRIFDLLWSCGIQTVLFLAGLQSIPRSLYEASRVEGATKWEEFWFITFPMLSRVTLLVLIFTFVEQMTNKRMGVIHNAYYAMKSGNYDVSSAMLWAYFLVSGGIMAILVLLYNRVFTKRWDA